jgi:hypothetical protein
VGSGTIASVSRTKLHLAFENLGIGRAFHVHDANQAALGALRSTRMSPYMPLAMWCATMGVAQ